MGQKDRKTILLTFDVEEFDLPLNYDIKLELNDQLQISHKGLLNILELLSGYPTVRATFFTTALFAKHYPETIRKMSVTHEIASHTYSNAFLNRSDLLLSRRILEKIISKPVTGIRMPQMQEVDIDDLVSAGYSYDSSINPTWIPGKYNNRHKPRELFIEKGITRIPASVATFLRVPLFWLSFKNISGFAFKFLANLTLKRSGYLNLYFHPWEFTDISEFNIPFYIKTGCNHRLLKKLDNFLSDFTAKAEFIGMDDFVRGQSINELQNSPNFTAHLR
jgi:peptidoglycan/xylan/chitin deacetylase (PgdA/CDA1 family)